MPLTIAGLARPTPTPAPITPPITPPADLVIETTESTWSPEPVTSPEPPIGFVAPPEMPATDEPVQFEEPQPATAETAEAETAPEEPAAPVPAPKSRAEQRRERAEQRAAEKAAKQQAKTAAASTETELADEREVQPEAAKSTGLPQSHSLGRTVLSTILPGAGLINVKPRRNTVVGIVVLVIFVALAVASGVIFGTAPSRLIDIAVRPTWARMVGVAAIVAALVWIAMIIGTYLVTRPKPSTGTQKAVGGIVTGVLCALVAFVLGVVAGYAFTAASTVGSIFGADTKSGTRPASASQPLSGDRMNILLLGAQSASTSPTAGATQQYTIQTVMVASVDVATGNTVLIQLPPDMARTPFPKDSKLADAYPLGFYDGASATNPDYQLGAIWNNVPKAHPELFTDTDFPGGDAMKQAVGAALGLQIDYFVLLDVNGVQQLVTAMGGVTVNVNFPVAMGGTSANDPNCKSLGQLTQGADQRLDGQQALWYASSICNDPQTEYGRMNRQSCLADAIATQAAPTTLVTRFGAVANALRSMTTTDIPQSDVPTLLTLADKAKGGTVLRLSFVNGLNGFNLANPNFGLMRQLVISVTTESENPTSTTQPNDGSQSTDVCAYTPQP